MRSVLAPPPRSLHSSLQLCLGTPPSLPAFGSITASRKPSLTAAILLSLPPAASTLSQLSDSGQTLSEDSGVDAGEVEASAPGRGRQTASAKNKSSKELPRTERATEGATKPVSGGVVPRSRGGAQAQHGRPKGPGRSLQGPPGEAGSPITGY